MDTIYRKVSLSSGSNLKLPPRPLNFLQVQSAKAHKDGNVHGHVFGEPQIHINDELPSNRAPKRQTYIAVGIYFQAFTHVPLSQLREKLVSVVPAEFLLRISFVRKFLSLKVWAEGANIAV